MDMPTSFGYWVRRRRKALDWTQGDLARRVGCAEVTIQKIEADERRPSRQVAERLAEQLAIPAEERAAFLQCARAEHGADRLAPPTQGLASAAAAPTAPDQSTPSAAALPSGTVTFLFTDIEGSTPLWEREPDRMALALARHDGILRTTIAKNGGHAYKKIGDAFQAAFAFPAQALAAALAAQHSLAQQPWETSDPLRVRMGLHVGPAVAEDNEYRTAHTLNRVARIMSSAHGGQILLSGEVADLVRRDLGAGVSLRDMGKHRMKGLMQLEHLFQIVAPDLPAAFPPLKTLDPVRTNLPVQLTSFVGREQEIAEIEQLLANHRLTTLTGPGGTGKTRLALQVAAEVLGGDSLPLPSPGGPTSQTPPRPSQWETSEAQRAGWPGGEGRFPDGVWLAELAPLADPALVPQTIASVLGLREESARPILTTLADFLSARKLLLILDNCEHVIEACAQLAESLLRACPNVRILASSREALGVAGEAPFRVPSLRAPDPRRLPSLEALTQYEAVRLFVERASAVLPGFTVTNANASALAQVCSRLDGIPLALELAAARVSVLRVEQIAARLDDRFRLLTGGSRTAVPRQQTLRALIDWSYDLLAELERVLLRRLAVFGGGWTLEAAETVCVGDGLDNYEVLDLLTQLVNKSLVLAEREQGQETRYRLLETIRQYALERLAASGEADTVRRRHAEHFLALAEQSEPYMRGAEQGAWLVRLEQEHDNVRAALGWALGGGDPALGVRLAAALGLFWYFRGYWSEGRVWFEAALAVPSDLERRTGVWAAARAMVLWFAGIFVGHQGYSTRATALAEEAQALFRTLGDQHGLAGTLYSLGDSAWGQGDYARAMAVYQEALALYQELGNRTGIADALHGLGDTAREQGDYAQASALLEKSLALHRELGDRAAMGGDLLGMGDVALYQGHLVRATELYQESLALFRETGFKAAIPWALCSLGRTVQAQGDTTRAVALLEECVALSQETKDANLAGPLHFLGAAVYAQGDAVRAEALLLEGLALQQQRGLKPYIAESLERFALLAAGQGQPERAARLLGVAGALRAAMGAPLPPLERPNYERTIAAARAQLDEATFAAAWAEGRTMTMEQAIAEALRH